MSISYKSCFVSYCTNTTVTTPGKKFVTVPAVTVRRKLWFEAARRKYKQTKTNYYCCEDHFDFENDMVSYYIQHSMMGGKIILKPFIVPHVFNWPESSSIKKLKLDELVVPNEPALTEDSHDYDVGTQTSSAMINQYQQTSPLEVKSVGVSCRLRSQNTVKLDTLDLTITKEASTSPMKKKFLKVEDITSAEATTETVPSSSDFVSLTDTSESKDEQLQNTISLVEKYPKRYIGVPKVWYDILINLLVKNNVNKEHVIICLMKIKLNDSFARLADQFSLSVNGVSKIFKTDIYKLEHYMKTFIFWPCESQIKKHLPIPFRAKYNNVQSIIDCFEIQIQKPTNPVHQALTWSQYKKCNTVKYLISCTPDGFVNFVSTGYGGRITDTTLTQECGYLNCLPDNAVVMADRGFKEIESLLQSKHCKLLRPPSVSSSLKPSKHEVMETKVIASLRIHVERVISRLREFAFLKPHSVIDHNLLQHTDALVSIACALINLQSPLIKS